MTQDESSGTHPRHSPHPLHSRPCKIQAMNISRRHFVHTGAAAGIGLGARVQFAFRLRQGYVGQVGGTGSARRAGAIACPRRWRHASGLCVPQADDGGCEADHERRACGARAEGAAADGGEQDQRDDARRRIEHVLFHRRALGPQRAAVRVRDPGAGRAGLGVAGLRGRTRARAGVEERRSARVAGRRKPLQADRRHSPGSRRRQRPHRRRRAAALLRLTAA